MKNLRYKVAVITGGVGGLGFAFAKHAARERMNIVLADNNEGDLKTAEDFLKTMGVEVLTVKTDVSKLDEIENLANSSLEAFGHVDLLFNNTGLVWGKTVGRTNYKEWRRLIGVNLLGVIYGIKVFLPIMLKQNSECHIVIMSSAMGLKKEILKQTASNGITAGLIGMSEALHKELIPTNPRIGVSVVIPMGIGKRNSRKNRNPPEDLADMTFKAIREDRLYVFPDGKVSTRMFVMPQARAILNSIRSSILH